MNYWINKKVRGDEAWEHAACLTIAETGQKWGDEVEPSLAMQAVYDLYHKAESLKKELDYYKIFTQVNDEIIDEIINETPTKEDLYKVIGGIYCRPEFANKVVDAELCIAIADEVEMLLKNSCDSCSKTTQTLL